MSVFNPMDHDQAIEEFLASRGWRDANSEVLVDYYDSHNYYKHDSHCQGELAYTTAQALYAELLASGSDLIVNQMDGKTQ